MLKKLVCFLILLISIYFVHCSSENSHKSNVLLTNKNIKNIYIIDNSLYYCEQNNDSSFKLVDYEKNSIVDGSLISVPTVVINDTGGYTCAYKENYGKVKVEKNGKETVYNGQFIWKTNSRFIITDYEYLGGKDYLGRLRSFPSNRNVIFDNYAIVNPYDNTKFAIVRGDSTFILTPQLKIITKTVGNIFNDYKGDIFKYSYSNCQLEIEQLRMSICLDKIIEIRHYNEHFYVLFQQSNFFKLANDLGEVIDSVSVGRFKDYSVIYNDSKLELGYLTDSSKYVYSSNGRTQLLAQYYIYNGEFYSIKESNNGIFFYREPNKKKVRIGKLDEYKNLSVLYDYFEISLNNKIIIVDKYLNIRGSMLGYINTYVKSDKNLFVLNTEGVLYKF